jgi:hypothetical protein
MNRDRTQDEKAPVPDAEADVVLVLRPLPSAVPADVRLRQLLKYALRCQGLKCVAVRDAIKRPPTAEPATEAGGQAIAQPGQS